MASVDVPVALLGYGTVGAAVHRLLEESADELERVTGHRLRVTRVLVRDAERERDPAPPNGLLTTDFATIRDDDAIVVVAEVMGGLEPAGTYVVSCFAVNAAVVTANKQLVAGAGLTLRGGGGRGVQLRFEASCVRPSP